MSARALLAAALALGLWTAAPTRAQATTAFGAYAYQFLTGAYANAQADGSDDAANTSSTNHNPGYYCRYYCYYAQYYCGLAYTGGDSKGSVYYLYAYQMAYTAYIYANYYYQTFSTPPVYGSPANPLYQWGYYNHAYFCTIYCYYGYLFAYNAYTVG